MEPTINTGNNLRKELERLEEVFYDICFLRLKRICPLCQVQLFYKFRNDEIFRRINVNNLVRILLYKIGMFFTNLLSGQIACRSDEVGVPVDPLQH